jgi:hypothetical protein
MKKFLVCSLVLFLAATGCAPYFTQHFADSFFAVAEKKKFSVEIIADKKDLGVEKNIVGFIVHDSNDVDVEHAELTVTSVPPVKGETGKIAYPVTEKGRGLYTAESLDLKEKGLYGLSVKVKKGDTEDIAFFLFGDNRKTDDRKIR